MRIQFISIGWQIWRPKPQRDYANAHLLPRFLDHRLGFELFVGEGPGTWIEVSPRWGHRERYKRQAILYSRRVLGICCAAGEQSTMSTLVQFVEMYSTSSTLSQFRFWDSVHFFPLSRCKNAATMIYISAASLYLYLSFVTLFLSRLLSAKLSIYDFLLHFPLTHFPRALVLHLSQFYNIPPLYIEYTPFSKKMFDDWDL